MLLGEDIHEREPATLNERIGDRLAAVPLQLGLKIKKLELARAAGHEEVDHALGPCREVARPGCQGTGLASAGRVPARGVSRSDARAIAPGRPRNRRRNAAGSVHEPRGPASSPSRHRSHRSSHHSRVTNSSRFRSTRATFIQPADFLPSPPACSGAGLPESPAPGSWVRGPDRARNA